MGYKFKSDSFIIDSPKNKIVPRPLPENPEDGEFCIDSVTKKLKVWNAQSNRWIIVGDASDIKFNNDTNGFSATDLQSAVEEARNTNAAIARTPALFGFDGTGSSGRWLEIQRNVPSNVSGFVVPLNGTIKELTMSSSANSTTAVTIYVNSIAVTTISLANTQKDKVTGLNISLNSLDEISAKVISGSSYRPVVIVFIAF